MILQGDTRREVDVTGELTYTSAPPSFCFLSDLPERVACLGIANPNLAQGSVEGAWMASPR